MVKDFLNKIKDSKNMSGIIRMIKNNDNYKKIIINETYNLYDCNIYERLFNIKNNIKERRKCPICKENKLEWNNKYKKCIDKNCKKQFRIINLNIEKEQERRKKISESQKNRSDNDKKIIREKIEKTNLEKYGKKTYAETDIFKKNMIKNYGYISPFEKKEFRDKSKKTLLQKYGVDHNFKIDIVRKKILKTFLKNYGVDNPTKNQIIKDKIKKTNNDRYGGNSPMQNNEIMEKSKKTLKKNYGVDSPLQSDYIFDKVKKQCYLNMVLNFGYKI